jgi:ribosome recycling factor
MERGPALAWPAELTRPTTRAALSAARRTRVAGRLSPFLSRSAAEQLAAHAEGPRRFPPFFLSATHDKRVNLFVSEWKGLPKGPTGYNANVDGRIRRHRDSPARTPREPRFGETAMKTEQPAATSGPTFNSIKEVETHLKTRMDKAVSDLQHEMAAIRTGRASLGILDHIRVDYYGTPTPLNQVANLHVPEPALITIQPWDVSQIGPIEKAIRTSDLGLNPANDGKIIRLPIPPLTEERRKELVKKLHAAAEHHRVSVRAVRRDGNEAVKKLLKDKKVTEDDDKKAHDEIQKLTDAYMAKIDAAAKAKEKDILEIK